MASSYSDSEPSDTSEDSRTTTAGHQWASNSGPEDSDSNSTRDSSRVSSVSPVSLEDQNQQPQNTMDTVTNSRLRGELPYGLQSSSRVSAEYGLQSNSSLKAKETTTTQIREEDDDSTLKGSSAGSTATVIPSTAKKRQTMVVPSPLTIVPPKPEQAKESVLSPGSQDSAITCQELAEELPKATGTKLKPNNPLNNSVKRKPTFKPEDKAKMLEGTQVLVPKITKLEKKKLEESEQKMKDLALEINDLLGNLRDLFNTASLEHSSMWYDNHLQVIAGKVNEWFDTMETCNNFYENFHDVAKLTYLNKLGENMKTAANQSYYKATKMRDMMLENEQKQRNEQIEKYEEQIQIKEQQLLSHQLPQQLGTLLQLDDPQMEMGQLKKQKQPEKQGQVNQGQHSPQVNQQQEYQPAEKVSQWLSKQPQPANQPQQSLQRNVGEYNDAEYEFTGTNGSPQGAQYDWYQSSGRYATFYGDQKPSSTGAMGVGGGQNNAFCQQQPYSYMPPQQTYVPQPPPQAYVPQPPPQANVLQPPPPGPQAQSYVPQPQPQVPPQNQWNYGPQPNYVSQNAYMQAPIAGQQVNQYGGYVRQFRMPVMKLQAPKLKDNPSTEEFIFFLKDFEEMVQREGIPPMYVMKYLAQAIESRETRNIIQSYASTIQGYHQAVETLKMRYGDEERLKIEKMEEVERFNYDTKTSLGLFKLSALINSIVSNAAFQGEYHRGSLLYQKFLSKLPYGNVSTFGLQVPKERQDLNALKEFVRILAETAMEQEKRKLTHSYGVKRESSQRPAYNYKAKHYSSKISEDDKKYTGKVPFCDVCKGPHFVYYCLKDKPREEVERIAREKKLCYNCLSSKHMIRDCASKRRCQECKGKHHSLFHYKERPSRRYPLPVEDKREEKTEEKVESYAYKGQQRKNRVEKLFPVKFSAFVVPAYVKNLETGQIEETIIYKDQGADETWMSTALYNKLKLNPMATTDCTIYTVNGKENYRNTPIVKVQLESLDKSTCETLTCRVMDALPRDCTYKRLANYKKKYSYLKDVPIMETTAKEVGICIGRDNCHLLNHEAIVQRKRNEPIAYKMKLGWTICIPKQQEEESSENFFIQGSNRVHLETAFSNVRHHSLTTEEKSKVKFLEDTTNEAVRKMLLEDNLFIEEKPPFNKQEEVAYNFVKDNFTYTKDGRPMTAIPFNEKMNHLKNNFPLAKGCLNSNTQRLEKAGIRQEFQDKIEDGIKKDYFEEVEDNSPELGKKNYIPLQCVIREDRETNRLRIVNNAAAVWQGMSLNDAITAGPNLQQDPITVILRFLKEKVAISIDVSEMFPQVIVRPEDRDMLRFLFKYLGEDEHRIFRHKRLPFGLNCSPFIAQFTVLQGAEKAKDSCPLGHLLIKLARYVDDIMASLAKVSEAIDALLQVQKIFKETCSMEVHKVLSNVPEVMEAIDQEKRWKNWTKGQELSPTKIFGMEWDPEGDVMGIAKPKSKCPTTKRTLLTASAELFDPLGRLSCFSIKVRIVLQSLWRKNLSWDEVLPQEYLKEAEQWFNQLDLLEEIKFPRMIAKGNPKHIHLFADASDYAYGFAAYFQTDIDCGLIMAKARVHSLKVNTIPRKELQAAVLASKAIPMLKKVWPDTPFTLWTDSQNVLAWIQSDSRQYKAYINNRVSAILDNSTAENWKWVDTANNPADLASRGINLQQLKACDLWWKGPRFLWDTGAKWPPEKRYWKTNEELKKNVVKEIFMNYMKLDWLPDVRQYKILNELAEETARLNRRRKNLDGPITMDDMEEALKILVKEAQAEGFPQDVAQLEKEGKVSARSKIVKLNPVLDSDGLIRCLTRLNSANIPESTSKPVLLPKDHQVTKLIILDQHEKTKHAYGVDYTLSEVRRRFWIPSGRQQIKKVLKTCRQCRINYGVARAPKMAPLPFVRTEGSSLPFTHASVDFSGAYITVQGRGIRRAKRYLCLFVCNETRAVHLELAYNLEADGFLMALANFTARRGRIKTLTCDNGTNFRGAQRELRLLIEQMDKEEIERYANKNGFEFRFNPPYASHMGGVFESLIKSAKRAIRAVLVNSEFTDSELQAAFIGAEDLLNSRPLGYQTNDPNDHRVLTPASFLHGRLDGSNLPKIIDDQEPNHKNRWRLVQLALKHIWQRWHREILPNLGPRQKWSQDSKNFEVGDEVLIMEKNIPRYKWNIGRVTATFPGRDGVVRVVNIKGKNGETLQKTVHRLIPLNC